MDINSRALLRRYKDSRRPPNTVQAGTNHEKQIAGNSQADFRATVLSYDPDSDQMTGQLPNGKEVKMSPITNGKIGVGDTVFYSQDFCDTMPR